MTTTRRGFIGRAMAGLVALASVPALPRLRVAINGRKSSDITLLLDGLDISGTVPVKWESMVRAARPGDVVEFDRFAERSGRKCFEYRTPGALAWSTTKPEPHIPGTEARLKRYWQRAVVVA